ncbi:DUF4260 domain-containing protein [Peribacillus simplex]|uniref:DUF4260 domain-containing protein n=1 Tax=Peribacillus simplex TaxID=1478 RepID=A0AAW7IQK4_9BACI|nr:DUF4260 domain-containing protein [Peribacillus simplex]MDM5452367.1 DUF4260 domain-containing protein [Peribacillus simplex]
MVKKFLHIEGLMVLLAMIYIYSLYEFSWSIFLLFILSPDVSMLAYLIDDRVGAKVYNLFHTYTLSIFMILLAIFLKSDALMMIGSIWTAHIGMDRLFGYGLKYTSSFKATHLQKV